MYPQKIERPDCVMVGDMAGSVRLDDCAFDLEGAQQYLIECGFTSQEAMEYIAKLPLEEVR